jgi:hypothetical protein
MENNILLIIFCGLLNMTVVSLKAMKEENTVNNAQLTTTMLGSSPGCEFTITEEDPEIAQILAYGVLNRLIEKEKWPKDLTKQSAQQLAKNFNEKISTICTLLYESTWNKNRSTQITHFKEFNSYNAIDGMIEYLEADNDSKSVKVLEEKIELYKKTYNENQQQIQKLERAGFENNKKTTEEMEKLKLQNSPFRQKEIEQIQQSLMISDLTTPLSSAFIDQQKQQIKTLQQQLANKNTELDESAKTTQSLQKEVAQLKANNAKLMILKKILWDQISDQTFSDLNAEQVEETTQNYLTKINKARIIANTLYPFIFDEYRGNFTIDNETIKKNTNKFSENLKNLHNQLTTENEEPPLNQFIPKVVELLTEMKKSIETTNLESKKNSPAAMKKINEEVNMQKEFFKMKAIAYTASAGFFITLIAYLLERCNISPLKIIGLQA